MKSSIFIFRIILLVLTGIFILARTLGTRLKFYEVLRFSWYFLSLKLFRNSWGNTLRSTCGERKIWSFIESLKILWPWLSEKLSFVYMSVPFVKRGHILSEIYYILLKIRSRPNLKVIQCQSLTSVKRSETYLLSKASFSTV